MTDIETEARRRLNEIADERVQSRWHDNQNRANAPTIETICRILEEFEAYKREVSEAIESSALTPQTEAHLARFILPKPVDPVVEAWIEATGNTVGMEPLNEALAKRGGRIVFDGEKSGE